MPLLRTAIGAALGCLILVVTPTGGQAAASRGGGHPLSPSSARAVLHRARDLMRVGPATTTPPASPDLTMALRDLHLARRTLTGADRRAADRLLSRSTPLAAARAASAGGTLTTRCSTHFCLHYGTSTTSAWAGTTLSTLEHVWSVEVPLMRRQPLLDGGTPDNDANPDNRTDVFLEDLGYDGYYGYCTTDDQTQSAQVPAYCALDDDFARTQFGAAPLSSLRVTAAHEFFHAIQFAADVNEDTWFMEGSATWVEDVVYDDINDNYQYLATSPIRHPRTSLDYSEGTFPYGSFVFFTYAAERRGRDVVRRFWDEAVGVHTSLQAVRAVVGASAWPAFFTMFGSWNTLPRHSYSERTGYPEPGWWLRRTLTAQSRSTGLHGVSVSHLGNAAVQASPGRRLRPRQRLLVEVDAPPRATGSEALLQRRYRDGRVTHTMIALGVDGNGRMLVPFNRRNLGSIVVVVSNTGAAGPARVFRVRASLR